MKEERVAIIAYYHAESTLPLVKHLAALGCAIDYYFITFPRQEGSSAFSFGRKTWFPGILWNNRKYMKELYEYMGSERVRIFLIVLPPYALRFLSIVSRLMFICTGFVIRWLNYDYVNVIGQNFPLLDLIRAIGHKPNLFVSMHEVTPHYITQNVDYSLINYLTNTGINIILHSNASLENLLKYNSSMIEMVTVIPFGVFETYLLYPPHKKVLNLPSRYILFYGAILPYKGLDVLYDAIAILGNRVGSLKIVVAGRGDDPVLKKIQRDERFIVVNRLLSNQEIVELNMGAYCVVCPYRSASQSGIVSTSFLFSVPIIASDVGGFTEYVVNHQNGLLVEPSNPKALSEAIATVLSDKALHTTLQQGAAAFEHATQFSWRGISKRYLDLFRQKTYKSKATLNGVEP